MNIETIVQKAKTAFFTGVIFAYVSGVTGCPTLQSNPSVDQNYNAKQWAEYRQTQYRWQRDLRQTPLGPGSHH